MLYHYTDRHSAADARREGRLKASPVIVRTALIGGDEVALGAAVWFTAAGAPAQTVLVKMQLAGWPLDRPGMVWRFGVAEETAALDLPAWAHRHGYGPQAFRWMLLTAQLVGEDWRDWRLSAADVPTDRWLSVEWYDPGKGIWVQAEAHS